MTGHTSGIGLSLYNIFIKHSEVLGFSRSTGHDIGLKISRQEILKQLDEYDIFINNAYHYSGQQELLNEILELWSGTSKRIINISSNIKTLPESFFVIKEINDYRNSKRELDNLIENYKGTVRILNVLPELTNTNFDLGIQGFDVSSGMNPDYVANTIYDIFVNSCEEKELIIKHWQWDKHAN